MQKLLSLIVALSAFSSVSQAGPLLQPGAGNASVSVPGNSLAEKKIRWIWSHRNDFIKACAMSDCIQQEPLKSLLPKLYQIAKSSDQIQLQFVSEKSNPGFFSSNLGESHRIAITGRSPDSPIYFNTDLIANLTFENIVAILFHEWTHHLGISDDSQRLPDQVGALMAKDFTKNLLYSPYAGPDNLRMESAVFQFPVPKDNLEQRFFNHAFAFLTDGNNFLDTDLGKFTLVSACDKEDHQIAAQKTGTPHWRDLGVSDGKRNLRLTMILGNTCYKANAAGQLVDYHFARRGYKFDIVLDKNGLLDSSSEELLGDSLAADLDFVSTLEFLSVNYNKNQVKAGEAIQISMRVKSYTDLKPHHCDFGISQEGAPLQAGGYPLVSNTPNCQVKVVGENLWEISTSFTVPPDMVGGNYYPRIIKVVGDGEPNTALLFLPEQNGFNVGNVPGSSGIAVQSVKVLGPKSTAKFGDQPLTNSYVYSQGQQIEVRIDVKSASSVRIKGLATYTLAAINNELQAVQNQGPLEDFTGFMMKQRTVDAGPGMKTIILTFTIPQAWQNAPLFGMSLQGIYLEDEGFQQTVWQAAGTWDYLFIEQRLFDSNR
ncbi:hypothetical protein [Bdellovibrio sp. HCB274]|uniref:hypothetical protein n=1 Tax=Bdellovibrio sp. HCB274 TaxID=3394361 RepID=UPI0039B4B0DD